MFLFSLVLDSQIICIDNNWLIVKKHSVLSTYLSTLSSTQYLLKYTDISQYSVLTQY